MINQIYHTSHCGSTLLVSLLRKTVKSYSEPSWTHQILKNNINFFDCIKQYESNGVIKLPSGLCHFAHQISGKKVFLYRQLKQHLFKIFSGYEAEYINYYYQYFQNNIHSSLKNIEFDTPEKQNVFLWANRIMWMSECKNILWIDCNDFLSNKEKTLDEVCNYFTIPQVNDMDLLNIHVKFIGMNNNDCELNQVIPNFNNLFIVDSEYGIISDEDCLNNNKIYQLLEWVNKSLSFIPQSLI